MSVVNVSDVKKRNIEKDKTFSPNQIQGNFVYLDAEYGAFDDVLMEFPAENANYVRALKDLSGQGNHYLRSGTINTPEWYSSGGLNNEPYVFFGDSYAASLECANKTPFRCLHDGTGFSMYMVLHNWEVSTGAGALHSNNRMNIANVGFSLQGGGGVDIDQRDGIARSSNGGANNLNTIINSLLPDTLSCVLSVRAQDNGVSPESTLTVRQSDGTQYQATSDYIAAPSLADATYNAELGGPIALGVLAKMNFHLLLIYNRKLNDHEDGMVMKYIKNRFGIK